jgi:hypothetical protein
MSAVDCGAPDSFWLQGASSMWGSRQILGCTLFARVPRLVAQAPTNREKDLLPDTNTEAGGVFVAERRDRYENFLLVAGKIGSFERT